MSAISSILNLCVCFSFMDVKGHPSFPSFPASISVSKGKCVAFCSLYALNRGCLTSLQY